MLVVRDATPQESAEMFPGINPGWVGLLEEDGEIVGRIALAPAGDAMIGHGFECRAKSRFGALLLYRAAVRVVGASVCYVHIPVGYPKAQMAFWLRMGYAPDHLVLKRDFGPSVLE